MNFKPDGHHYSSIKKAIFKTQESRKEIGTRGQIMLFNVCCGHQKNETYKVELDIETTGEIIN